MNGNKGNLWSILENGVINPETMIGSGTVKVTPTRKGEIKVVIFNVTSLTSGDLSKHLPWNSYPSSTVRSLSKEEAIDMVGYENILKASYVEIKIFKETNYTIQFDAQFPLETHSENLVLLAHFDFVDGLVCVCDTHRRYTEGKCPFKWIQN